MTRKKYQPWIRPLIDTELLGESVKVGTEEQLKQHLCPSALVVKEASGVRIKFDDMEDSVPVKRSEIWVRNPAGRNGRPLR